jgi:hypothetical protein|tara:strand:+ start:64 stop:864 length:801 start_codon:yes stop_codon:yes gene_type:complete
MKKIIYSIFALLLTSLAFSQAVEMEEITLNDGMEKDYIKFENMYSSAHEKVQQNGEKAGWFLFKVIPTEDGTQWPPNSSTPWCDFVLFNIYSDDSQLDGDWGMGSNEKEAQAFVRKANYRKMKNSEMTRLFNMSSKFRKKTTRYTLKGVDATIDVGPTKIGDRATLLGVEQLNEDYEMYESMFFKKYHNKQITDGVRLAWYLNKISERSENAYQPISHMIFERFNTNRSSNNNSEQSFTEKMMSKNGSASRKIHGGLILELVNFKQ